MNPGLYNRIQSLQTPLVDTEKKTIIKEETKVESKKEELAVEKKLTEHKGMEIAVSEVPPVPEVDGETADEYTEYTGDEKEGEEETEDEEEIEEEDVPSLIANAEEEIVELQNIIAKLKEKI